MKDNEEIEEVFKTDDAIKKIVDKLRGYKFDELKKTDHYEWSLVEKDTSEKDVIDRYYMFDKIKLILLRKRKNGFLNYDFHYEIEKGEHFLIAISLHRDPPELLNAYPFHTNFKKFIKSILGRYSDRIN